MLPWGFAKLRRGRRKGGKPETRETGDVFLRFCGGLDTFSRRTEPPSIKKPHPVSRTGHFEWSGLLAVGLAGPGPDQRVALAVLIVEKVGEDRRVEAGVIQFDREVIAALVGALGPGGPDLGFMRCTA